MPLTDEQKKIRATSYGASQIATLVGEGGGSLMDLYAEKIGHPAPESTFDDNLPVQLGRLEEPAICDEYARRTGTFLAPVTTLRHPEHPLIVATPDRACFTTEAALLEAARTISTGPLMITTIEQLSSASKLVEAKRHASQFRKNYGQPGTGMVPTNHAIQALVQMAVTGQRVVDLAVLFSGEFGARLDVFTIVWNPDVFSWLADEVARFDMDHVQKRVPPPFDGSDRADEALSRMFPADIKPPMVADADDERLMLDFAKWRAVEHRSDKLKKSLAQTLKNRIGLASGLTSASLGKLSWKRTRDSTDVDWQKAATDALQLAGQCVNAFGALRDAGEHLEPALQADLEARLKSIVPGATKTVSGHRRLLLTPRKGGDADLELARLALTLDALESGE
jgi:predicted phage-related endonuclease